MTQHTPGPWAQNGNLIEGPRHYECAVGQVERDEALLRQALKALELRCGTHADERKELIPALRERLGD